MNLFRRLFLILSVFGLLLIPAQCEDSFNRLSNCVDQWGHLASFWDARVNNKDYKVLKLKSSDKQGEADFVFKDFTLDEFESKLGEFKLAQNKQKQVGATVYFSTHYADARLNLIFANINGVKVKAVQVVQEKAGQGKQEHAFTIDKNYGEFLKALKKAK